MSKEFGRNASMVVRHMQTVVYDEQGVEWDEEHTPDPTWEQIDAAIRRLDKFRFPFVWLYLKPLPASEQRRSPYPKKTSPDFEVVGGKRVYWMAGSVQGYFQRRYSNPMPNGDDEVRLWVSDQGFTEDDRFVCHDDRTVLQAVSYFCKHGDFDPSLSWEVKEKIDDGGCPEEGT